ncbi:MAG: GNAT family N-acetyltransferase [Bacteroidota bacterium]
MIRGEHIILRTATAEDTAFILEVENTPEAGKDGDNDVPYTREAIEEFVLKSYHDIYTEKQIRLIIELTSGKPGERTGIIDLFDFSARNRRAAIGIWIMESQRKQGYATEAITLLLDYCFEVLGLHQVYCTIDEDNDVSLQLFKKCGFVITGTRQSWIARGELWKNELTLQLIKD